ncbi:MAG: histidinol-phosphate transaminase [Candidatus Aminicenantes bacterium]|nr:histidinol-phosphate transaminase [Candidatus Aminicenantes bacterium]
MNDLINPNIIGLNPYVPGIPLEEIKLQYKLKKVIKLASNENPFPLPANVIKAIKKEIGQLNRYPDSDSHELKNSIGQYHGIDSKNIIVGSGSVEILKMIIKTFLKPGETVLTSKKTFCMFKIATIEHAGISGLVETDMDENYHYDLDKMHQKLDSKTKIIFIANPDNPTGTMISRAKILDFISKIPDDIFIVLDNAYQEYVTNQDNHLDGIDLAINRKNIIVLRTFSKIYALAGLRTGYGISNENTINYLNQVRLPFNVTRIAQKAARVSLENEDFKEKSAQWNQKNREFLLTRLQKLGFRVIPSETNFLLFFPNHDIQEMNSRLLREGVIIRPLQAFGIPEGFRVTIGSEEDIRYFSKKLEKIENDLS